MAGIEHEKAVREGGSRRVWQRGELFACLRRMRVVCLFATHARAQIDTCAQDYKFGDGSKAIARDIKAGVQDLKHGFEGAVRVVTKKEVGASASACNVAVSCCTLMVREAVVRMTLFPAGL